MSKTGRSLMVVVGLLHLTTVAQAAEIRWITLDGIEQHAALVAGMEIDIGRNISGGCNGTTIVGVASAPLDTATCRIHVRSAASETPEMAALIRATPTLDTDHDRPRLTRTLVPQTVCVFDADGRVVKGERAAPIAPGSPESIASRSPPSRPSDWCPSTSD